MPETIAIVNMEDYNWEHIKDKMEKRVPFIIRNADIGNCKNLWKPEYLIEKIGQKSAVAHVSDFKNLDFLEKNFEYKTMSLSQLISEASDNHAKNRYYMRALGTDTRKIRANFEDNFPPLVEDFKIPPVIVRENIFSTVFRLASANVQLWTHYDIMDNILVQIVGRKRVVLFSPSDVPYLHLIGDKSAVTDIDNPDLQKYPNFAGVTRIEGIMEPGDMIFLPALWFHNMLSLEFSVALNIFWMHMPSSFYDSGDVYGNKDPVDVKRAYQSIDRAMNLLGGLPREYADFFMRRAVSRIQEKIERL